MVKKKFKAVGLNKLDDETVSKIREWRNSDFVRQNMYTQHEITIQEHEKYIQSLRDTFNRGLFVFYLDDEPFGVYQYSINSDNNCVVGGHYLIDEEYQYMGYGVIMSYFISVINFDILNCNKSYGEVIATNSRVIEMNKKMKVILEGVLRQHALIGEKYVDVYCYGALKDEWVNDSKELKKMVFKFVDESYEIIN